MLRLGLCCVFRDQPIKFGVTTAFAMAKLSRADALARLGQLCSSNADNLLAALQYCSTHGIGCFRVLSQILPLKTHPMHGYRMEELPGGAAIVERFRECGAFARRHGIRTCLHPDQYVVLNSPRPEVVQSAIEELEYQAEVAAWVGADVINIHGGGAYGDKTKALAELERTLDRLPHSVRERLTLENDDHVFTPGDLLPLCRRAGVPLVYDVHHHRCLPDRLSVEEATTQALATWNREPLFHISSPLEGWKGPKPERHHDFIKGSDFPQNWLELEITVEVEAKAKEAAVFRLQRYLARVGRQRSERSVVQGKRQRLSI